MLASFQGSLRQTLRRSGFGAVGALLLVCGIGFLTAATWVALALAYGALIASLILGLVFCGGGLVCLAMATRKSPPLPPATTSQDDLLAAFLGGLKTGRAMSRRSSAPP